MNRIRQTAAAAIDSGLPGVFAWIESGVWPRSCDGAVQASRLVHERVANAIDCAYLDARRDIEAKRDAMDDGADIGEMRQALDRRGEAIEALELELADLRAKLALQQQIATGAATQRDEQTARLAEAQAEIARLRAERACKQCGKRLDAWCEQCDVPDEGTAATTPPVAADLGYHKARAERLREALKQARESCYLDEWAPMSTVKDASSVGTGIGYDLDEDDRLEREWASLRSTDRVSLTDDQARQLWNDLSGFDTTTAWSDLDQVHRAGFARAVVAHLGLTPATPQTGEVGT